MSCGGGDLDRYLEHLREWGLAYRGDEADVGVWWAQCPACRGAARTLMLREHDGPGGPIDARCTVGCDAAEILAVLERDPALERIEAAAQRDREALKVDGGLLGEDHELEGAA